MCACRFLCRQRLGYRADKNAEYLMPVPQESVVYGSGETAVVLSKVCCSRDAVAQRAHELAPCSCIPLYLRGHLSLVVAWAHPDCIGLSAPGGIGWHMSLGAHNAC